MSTCLYRNGSDRMVILRCIGPDQFFLEKVIFPFETWCFDTPCPCEVELWSHAIGGPDLLDRFSSGELEIASGGPPAGAGRERELELALEPVA